MDFFEHQDRARRNSRLLFLYFGVTVVLVITAVYFALIAILALATRDSENPVHVLDWNPQLLAAVVGAVVILIATGSIYKTWMLGDGGEHVAVALGGVKVPANSTVLEERILLNVVEEMALAAGTPVPPVYLLKNELGINAFAAGTTPQNAVVGITRGAIQTLTRDELQGVIAHEFSHILNGDMRLNLRLIGLLHGILIVALLGYMFLRVLTQFPMRSSRDSDENKGAIGLVAALFMVGGALVAIGYIGVFFANMIKSAISRQREFLADASAVQFTRNPSGIADALKKIGGWSKQAKLQSARATEASHMFFGNGVASLIFATHPPLETRVKRIDPRFEGHFQTTVEVSHSLSELIDPRSLSMQLACVSASHQSAISGAEQLETRPQSAADQIGEPTPEHIEHVHGLIDQLDDRIAQDVREPLGAVAVIYALLLAPKGDETRPQQWLELEKSCDPRAFAELKRVLPSVDRLEVEQRLPVVCLSLPALHQMSPPQVNAFRLTVRKLIEADRKWTLFEFAVQRFITKRLVQRLSSEPVKQTPQPSLKESTKSFQVVLSSLAYAGGNASDPRHAFIKGAEVVASQMGSMEILPRENCLLRELNLALDGLEKVASNLKRLMLDAFAECIAADQRVTLDETELLRVISDALGCPMPPIIANES